MQQREQNSVVAVKSVQGKEQGGGQAEDQVHCGTPTKKPSKPGWARGAAGGGGVYSRCPLLLDGCGTLRTPFTTFAGAACG